MRLSFATSGTALPQLWAEVVRLAPDEWLHSFKLGLGELAGAQRASAAWAFFCRVDFLYTLRITAVPAVHRALLNRCQPLAGAKAVPAQRKARREYENRVNVLDQ
ncbi:hypothetical protein [Streptomyces tibetensis]|uniref:hypothetical protein n=1 Tax=Streptomyces tibetensis TaxID=2382123 RepID=UPI0033C99AB6